MCHIITGNIERDVHLTYTHDAATGPDGDGREG